MGDWPKNRKTTSSMDPDRSKNWKESPPFCILKFSNGSPFLVAFSGTFRGWCEEIFAADWLLPALTRVCLLCVKSRSLQRCLRSQEACIQAYKSMQPSYFSHVQYFYAQVEHLTDKKCHYIFCSFHLPP